MIERRKRLAEVLQRELARLLGDLKDPGLAGLVTLTGVEVSADAKAAFAYYSVLGSRRERASTAKALERAAPYLRRALADVLSLRAIPRVEFRFDGTPERAQRVEDLLARIRSEERPGEP